jgi:hypothetical protein
VSTAAACVKHPAGYANIIYLLFIYYSLFIKCLQRQHALGILRIMAAIMIPFIYFIIHLSFSACSGSMREASCGSMIPLFIILIFIISLFIVYYLQRQHASSILWIMPILYVSSFIIY